MTAVIEISGLRKTFHSLRRGEKTALDGFDMAVEKGQVHGFLGPNGSGKTTTLRTLLGLLRPDEGDMRILGTMESPNGNPDRVLSTGRITATTNRYGSREHIRTSSNKMPGPVTTP